MKLLHFFLKRSILLLDRLTPKNPFAAFLLLSFPQMQTMHRKEICARNQLPVQQLVCNHFSLFFARARNRDGNHKPPKIKDKTPTFK